MEQSARKDEVMIKAITKLIIASAGLWLALPAAAQFEINPDHFDGPAMNLVQPRAKESKRSMRSSLSYEQVQRHRVQAFKKTKSPANTLSRLSKAAAVQHRRVSGASRVVRKPLHRNTGESS